MHCGDYDIFLTPHAVANVPVVARQAVGCGASCIRSHTAKGVPRILLCFFFQAEDGIRVYKVTGVQTCALPISGYIASRLIPRLIEASADVSATSRSPHALGSRFPGIRTIASDLMDRPSLEEALRGVQVAYYLVHSMDANDFEERDRASARNFLDAAEKAKVERIVYLSGLGRADDRLSKHLLSRHEVGAILASGNIPVTELRAAIVIGSGSSAFDMLRYLTERLPAMIAPRWLATRIQPISEGDLISYLIAAGSEPHPGGIVE